MLGPFYWTAVPAVFSGVIPICFIGTGTGGADFLDQALMMQNASCQRLDSQDATVYDVS